LQEFWEAKKKFLAKLPEKRSIDYEIYLRKMQHTKKGVKKGASISEANGNLNHSEHEMESEPTTDAETSPKKKKKNF
jgi:hypothetical protein